MSTSEKVAKITKLKIKELLADYLGTEVDEIAEDDSLREDFHMKATEMADFTEVLETEGINTSSLDFTNIETVEELFDALNLSD